ncbi:MAG: DUF1186 domain-containing protein [Flavobacteriales bacterium]|nr:DUF1186 domain-containing protein [Flavobacteriales bacterium]
MTENIQIPLENPKSFAVVDDEFLDETVHEIYEWSKDVCKNLLASKEAKLLFKDFEDSDVSMAISCFTEMCYGYHLQKPGQWTASAVKDVCLHVMPRKVLCDDVFFKNLAKILSIFLVLLEKNGFKVNNIKSILNSLRKHEYDILKNARSSSNWGIAKSMFKSAPVQDVETIASYNEDLSIEENLQLIKIKQDDFPEGVLENARAHKDKSQPVLRSFLSEAKDNANNLDQNYIGHCYALYLLSEFRDQLAFPLIMDIARLPEEELDILLGDMLTENLHQFIGSTYDGNIQLIKELIENPAYCLWARDAALRSLLILVNNKKLEREYVINYFDELLNNDAIINDESMMAFIAGLSCDIYAEKVFEKLKKAFESEKIDLEYIKWQEVEETIKDGMELTLEYSLESSNYEMIEDGIEEMGRWNFFRGNNDEPPLEEYSDFDTNNVIKFEPKSKKVGRNDPCPCGSGKKYKKCCLN